MMDDFLVCVASPDGYVHSAAFAELADVVHYTLLRMGKRSLRVDLTAAMILDPAFAETYGAKRWILFGPHLLQNLPTVEVPKGSVIYNLEARGTDMFALALPHLQAASHVWDFSRSNTKALAELGIAAHFVPPGYAPELERCRPQTKDVDVLFYGCINERRALVLAELRALGLDVCHFGEYGATRDYMIARSKVVLSMHFYETPGLFESVRVSHALTNGACVVAEEGDGQEGYDEAAVCVPYGKLAATAERYVREHYWRDERAARSQVIMRERFDEAELLKRTLEAMALREESSAAADLGRALGPTAVLLSLEHAPAKPTLCLIVTGADTAAFERMDFLEVARAEADELVLIKTKDGRFGGQGAIYNRVAERTECDVVGIVHADTTFGPGALSTFAATAAEGKVCGLVGRALDGRYVWSREVSRAEAVSTLDGCSFFAQRGRCFDEKTFPSFHCGVEDACLAAAKCGLPVVVPRASAYHHSSTTGTYLNPEWQAQYWATREKLVAKWPGREFQTT